MNRRVFTCEIEKPPRSGQENTDSSHGLEPMSGKPSPEGVEGHLVVLVCWADTGNEKGLAVPP